MTKAEELDLFLNRAEELIESKYIIADIKIINLLKAIASSETLIALFKNCLNEFDYQSAKKECLIKSKFSEDKGEYIQPVKIKNMIAFVFSILVEIDSKEIDFPKFLNKFFYIDGSFSSAYQAFIEEMIKPFVNALKLMIGSILEGKLQDPIDAVCEIEEKKRQAEKDAKDKEKAEKELKNKESYNSIKAIKDVLLKNKVKINNSKIAVTEKDQMLLIIDTFANAIEGQDRDKIIYSFVSYKYLTLSKRCFFRGALKEISKHIKGVLNGI